MKEQIQDLKNEVTIGLIENIPKIMKMAKNAKISFACIGAIVAVLYGIDLFSPTNSDASPCCYSNQCYGNQCYDDCSFGG